MIIMLEWMLCGYPPSTPSTLQIFSGFDVRLHVSLPFEKGPKSNKLKRAIFLCDIRFKCVLFRFEDVDRGNCVKSQMGNSENCQSSLNLNIVDLVYFAVLN